MRECWQRPSIAVGIGAVLLIAGFVWHGELRVSSGSLEAQERASAPAPVVVRRERSQTAAPMTLRKGRVFDARGFLLVGAEVGPLQQASVRSDGDGAFRFAAPVGSCIDVLVRSEGMLPRWLRSCDGEPDALVAQLLPEFTRQSGSWSYREYVGESEVVDIKSIGCSLLLRDIYAKLR